MRGNQKAATHLGFQVLQAIIQVNINASTEEEAARPIPKGYTCCTVREVSEYTGIRPQCIKGALAHLERNGLVEKDVLGNHSNLLGLTEEGLAVLGYPKH